MHAQQLLDVGGECFWVALTKQDLLPSETRDETVRKLKGEYEKRLTLRELASAPKKFTWKVLSQPGLSMMNDEHIWSIYDEIWDGLEQRRKRMSGGAPKAATPTIEMLTDNELRERIQKEALTDVAATEFWKHLTTAQLPAWNHRFHLRAGYMIYLETLSKMGSIWDAVEEFLKQLEQLRSSNPQRFTNTQHR